MTAAILPFVGTVEKTARENIQALIKRSKSARFFRGPNALEWTADPWDFAPHYPTMKKSAGFMAHFTNYDTTRRGNRSIEAVQVSSRFLEVARAILIEHLRTTSDTSPSKMMTLLRLIELAFLEADRLPDLVELNDAILERVAVRIEQDYADKFTLGRLLERLVTQILDGGRLTKLQLTWRNPFPFEPAPRNDSVNVKVGISDNVGKLPHIKSILDLAGVFHSSDYPPDQVVTGFFALAMFAPQRGNEILWMPIQCQTESQGIFGLSWRPLKGGDPMTKFAVTPEWADLAKTAVARLETIGRSCRKAAQWYERKPDSLYLPPAFEHLRGQPVTFWEAAQIVGRKNPIEQGSSIDKALVRVSSVKDASRGPVGASNTQPMKTVSFESLERWVIETLPKGFPIIDPRSGLLASEALFCLPLHVLRGDGDTYENVPSFITASQINHEFGSKPAGKTVYARHNLIDGRTGKPWKLTTHQPRHFLNTLAQSKFLAQELIAFWSGRKSTRQNDWYNHLSQQVFIELWKAGADGAGEAPKLIGPLADKVDERAAIEMISRDDALRLELGSMITTRYGLCRHNFVLTPCPKDKNCIGCGEITFIKGDEGQLAEARQQFAINDRAYDQAREAHLSGHPGAAAWMEKHQEKASRWRQMIDRMTDDTISNGTLITLPPPASSQTRAGLSAAIREHNGFGGENECISSASPEEGVGDGIDDHFATFVRNTFL